MAGESRIALKPWQIALTLAVVVAIIIAYTIYRGVSLSVLFAVNPLLLVVAIALYTLSWFISGLRLKIIHESISSKKLGIPEYFYARMLGGLVAYLTPSAIGGEIARAYYLARKAGYDMATGLAVAVYELFIDILFINVFALLFSLEYLPLSTPVILVSLFVISSWIMLFTGIVRGNRAVDKFFKLLLKLLPSSIRDRYDAFSSSLTRITRGIATPRRILAVSVLTTLIHLTAGFVVYVVALNYGDVGVLTGFKAYIFALAMGALPTPGGAAAVEYGLTIALKPEAVIASRVLMYFYTIILGLFSLLTLGGQRK